MGCMLFCERVSVWGKKSEVLLCVCLCAEVGVIYLFIYIFFNQALRAFCSSQIIMLLKGLRSSPGAERQHYLYPHPNVCSTSFDASFYCSNKQGSHRHQWFYSRFHAHTNWIKLQGICLSLPFIPPSVMHVVFSAFNKLIIIIFGVTNLIYECGFKLFACLSACKSAVTFIWNKRRFLLVSNHPLLHTLPAERASDWL